MNSLVNLWLWDINTFSANVMKSPKTVFNRERSLICVSLPGEIVWFRLQAKNFFCQVCATKGFPHCIFEITPENFALVSVQLPIQMIYIIPWVSFPDVGSALIPHYYVLKYNIGLFFYNFGLWLAIAFFLFSSFF